MSDEQPHYDRHVLRALFRVFEGEAGRGSPRVKTRTRPKEGTLPPSRTKRTWHDMTLLYFPLASWVFVGGCWGGACIRHKLQQTPDQA